MARINVDTSKTYDFRSDSVTVKAALAFLARQKDTGDEEAEPMSEADLAGWAICYAARRVKALAKDQARFDKGAKPLHVYTARVKVDGATQNAAEKKAEARALLARALNLRASAVPASAVPATPPARRPRVARAS